MKRTDTQMCSLWLGEKWYLKEKPFLLGCKLANLLISSSVSFCYSQVVPKLQEAHSPSAYSSSQE